MATFVDSAVPAGNPTTGFTVTIPAGVQADDILYLAFTSRDHTAGTAQPTVTDNDTGGNTWTQKTTSSDRKAQLWWKRATSATAGKTITVAGCVGSAAGVLKVFRGVINTGDPLADGVMETNASGDESHAGFTPTNAFSLLCAIVFNYANDNAVTSLSFATAGATSMVEKLSTGGSDCGCAFGHIESFSSATGTLTWAQTNGTTYSLVFSLIPLAVSASLVCQLATASALSSDGSLIAGSIMALTAAVLADAISDFAIFHATNSKPSPSRKAGRALRGGFF